MYADPFTLPSAAALTIPEDDEDDDPLPEVLEMPTPARVFQSAPELTASDKEGLDFWRSLNEAEQRWLITAGSLARRVVRWASRLVHSPKILKVRTFTEEGGERRPQMASSFRYVSVKVSDDTFWFTLASEELLPECEAGTRVELEFEGGPPVPVLYALGRSSEEFPFPELVFFPDHAQS